MKAVALVALGSAIGGACRYGSQVFVAKYYLNTFPLATFLVNVLGCFCIGVFYALSEKENLLSADWRLFLTTGLCGGFTTFSAFAYENLNLLRSADYTYFALYTAASVVAGIFAVYAGIFLMKFF